MAGAKIIVRVGQAVGAPTHVCTRPARRAPSGTGAWHVLPVSPPPRALATSFTRWPMSYSTTRFFWTSSFSTSLVV
jgi:hypothetical protein